MPEEIEEIRRQLVILDEADAQFSLRRAVASFLFIVMPVDGHTHPKEMERLTRILSDEFDLTEKESQELIEQAKLQSFDQKGMESTAKIIKAGFSKSELMTLVSHMWEMVFADGRLHETEVVLVERVAALLDIPQEDVSKAMIS